MASFNYRGRGGRGDVMQGIVEAANAQAVAAQLLNSGITPIEINEYHERADVFELLRRRLRARKPSIDELALFCRQMYTLLRAGVPINQAFNGLIQSSRNPMFVVALKDIRSHLESGRELSSGLAHHPRIFSALFISTIRIGEQSGRLEETFLSMSEYLERDRDTRAKVKSALRYPVFVIIAIAVAVTIINVVVVPQFAQIFARAGVELPLPTRLILATSDAFVNYWHWMLLAIAALVVMFKHWLQSETGRYRWDRYKLKLPIVGEIVYRATIGRFARGFAMSLQAGVPLVQALSVMSHAVDNEFIGERIRNMRTGVERGEALTRAASATGMFDALVLQMFSVGEQTGAVDELIAEIAAYYEREVAQDVKNLSQAIEPVLIVVLAAVVLVFALGVFLPMWDLASVKMNH